MANLRLYLNKRFFRLL